MISAMRASRVRGKCERKFVNNGNKCWSERPARCWRKKGKKNHYQHRNKFPARWAIRNIISWLLRRERKKTFKIVHNSRHNALASNAINQRWFKCLLGFDFFNVCASRKSLEAFLCLGSGSYHNGFKLIAFCGVWASFSAALSTIPSSSKQDLLIPPIELKFFYLSFLLSSLLNFPAFILRLLIAYFFSLFNAN